MSSQLRLSIYGALATMGTSLSLLSVFSGLRWLFPVLIGIVIVAAACAAIRRSPLPSAFEPIAASLGILIWVTVLYAHSDAWLGVIPSARTFTELNTLARSGFTEIHKVPTPAPANDGLVMLTVIGVAAIALVVDLMTVTLRRAALSGLPLLALFTVCAATGHHGVGIIAFITSAVGYLWLLYADNREKVARWGAAVGTGSRARPASAWSTDAVSAPAPASLGRQVGAVAISVGVLIPLFIPGLHTGINKHGSGGGGGSCSNGCSVQTFDPLVRVGADLAAQSATPVLHYTTTAPNPGYLRLTSLDVYDGTSFTEGSLSAPSNATASEDLPVVAGSGPTITTTTTISPSFDAHWLPVQTTALGVSVNSQWRYDPLTQTIFSATTNTEGLSFKTTSVSDQPTAFQLAGAARPTSNLRDLALPQNLDPRIRQLTKRVTAGATSDYQAALDIQRYFTTKDRFTYDTSIPANTSSSALSDFLFKTKRGFCQQFAAAMTVMARISGIPARVAVGFTAGTESDGVWTVTTHDAHAWPELWFQGFGWLQFEPTPRGDGQAVTPAYAKGVSHKGHGNNTNAGKDQSPTGRKGGDAKSSKPSSLPKTDKGNGLIKPVHHHHHRAADITVRVLWILLILLALLLVIPGIARLAVRRRRWSRLGDPTHGADAAWSELRDTAVDFRLPWPADRSPREVAAAILDEFRPAAPVRDAMMRIARCEERARYAAIASDPGDLKADVSVVRSAVARHASRQTRMVAWLLPRSAVAAGWAAASRGSNRVEQLARYLSPVRAIGWIWHRLAHREQLA